jgi:hypothetical protein
MAVTRSHPRWLDVPAPSSPFYAVSRVVGLSAAYTCVVSDGIEAPTWDDGHRDIHHARGVLQDLIVATLSRILGQFSPGK